MFTSTTVPRGSVAVGVGIGVENPDRERVGPDLNELEHPAYLGEPFVGGSFIAGWSTPQIGLCEIGGHGPVRRVELAGDPLAITSSRSSPSPVTAVILHKTTS